MFNKVKEIFGYNNNQKVITIVEKTPVVGEVIEKGEDKLDISSPVHTLVDKIKQNHKKLEFTLVEDRQDEWYRVLFYEVSYGNELVKGVYKEATGIGAYIDIAGICLTKDEEIYILTEVSDIYHKREARYRAIKEQRNRAKMQKLLEES